jgi:carbon-monoxide dehydrogenase medium subunit
LVLQATVHLAGPAGTRQVGIGDFFVGLLTTALKEDEVITHLAIPMAESRSGSSYLKMEHPASGYAVCGAAAWVSDVDGQSAVRLALNGVTATPQRALTVEAALAGSDLSDGAIDEAVDSQLAISEPLSDAFASAEFRSHLARVWSKRALKSARDRMRS